MRPGKVHEITPEQAFGACARTPSWTGRKTAAHVNEQVRPYFWVRAWFQTENILRGQGLVSGQVYCDVALILLQVRSPTRRRRVPPHS